MKDFVKAATTATKKSNKKVALTEFKHEGTEVAFRQPGSAQLSIMMVMSREARRSNGGDDNAANTITNFLSMFFDMATPDTAEYFRDRLMDFDDDFDLTSDNGVLEVFGALMDEWSSGKAEKKSTGSQRSQRATGGRSTASTRAKGSTSSKSRSRAS